MLLPQYLSTLAMSPAFSGAEEEATSLLPTWVAECRAYAAAIKSKAPGGMALILGHQMSAAYQVRGLTELYERYEAMEKKAIIAARLAKLARDASRRLLEGDLTVKTSTVTNCFTKFDT